MHRRFVLQAVMLGIAQFLVLAIPAVGQRSGMVIGAEVASEVFVKPVTDEPVVRPPRRAGDTLYLCVASFRSSRTIEHPWGGDLTVVLFPGESKAASAEVAPGIRARLTCSIDATRPKAGAWLQIDSVSDRKVLLSSIATFWLGSAGR